MLPVITYQSEVIPAYLENPYLSGKDTGLIIALVKSVKAKVMIEFGCQEGRTAWALLQSVHSLKRYCGIDVPSDYIPALDCQRGEVSEMPGYFARRDPRFELIIRQSGSFDLEPGDLPFCDAVFIDGDHSKEAVRYDSNLAHALMRSPGIIIWHDYGNPDVEVTEALDRLYREGFGPLKAIKDSLFAICEC